jgi:hypothetical protein
VVVSDHGWEYNGKQHDNKPAGVVFAWGPPFERGVKLKKARILDVMPILLHVLGIPESKELPGKVLSQAFKPEYRKSLPKVSSFGPRGPRIAAAAVAGDSDHLERLRALGYVE